MERMMRACVYSTLYNGVIVKVHLKLLPGKKGRKKTKVEINMNRYTKRNTNEAEQKKNRREKKQEKKRNENRKCMLLYITRIA